MKSPPFPLTDPKQVLIISLMHKLDKGQEGWNEALIWFLYPLDALPVLHVLIKDVATTQLKTSNLQCHTSATSYTSNVDYNSMQNQSSCVRIHFLNTQRLHPSRYCWFSGLNYCKVSNEKNSWRIYRFIVCVILALLLLKTSTNYHSAHRAEKGRRTKVTFPILYNL